LPAACIHWSGRLLDELNYRATVRAETRLTLWALDAGELGTLREGHPTLDAALRACRPGSEAPLVAKLAFAGLSCA
jgi:hypothetical protein